MEKVLRVSQLDSTELDDDLLSVLQEQLLGVFKVLPSTRPLQFKPELRAALKVLLWWYSVRNSGRTFGQDMLNVQYCTCNDVRRPATAGKKLGLLLLSVGVEWVGERFHALGSALAPGLRPGQLQSLLGWITAAFNLLSLLNFTLFLLRGCYPTLLDRLLGLQLAPTKPQTLRTLSYGFMNQEILWHGFSEFVFFVLPHLNLFAVRNWLRRVAMSLSATPVTVPADFSRCAFCGHPPTLPQLSACGHVYCYYCLRANCMADSSFPCCVCGHVLAAAS